MASWRSALAVLATCLAIPAAAQDGAARPSFDCGAATAPVELLICANAELADLDRALADSYRAALASRAGEAQQSLRETQRTWADTRAANCGIGDPATEGDDAAGCLFALYRARIAELQPGKSGADVVSPSGYGWLMGNWNVVAVRSLPADAARSEAAKAQLGRTVRFAEAPVTTLGGAACSFPHYRAEPAPGPEFGDLSDYPAAVMVRLSCVGIALLDIVRLTDEKILIGEGDRVFELERRR
jgi:uncharacterized protein